MSQEANCFIRMGETQNGVLLRMGQLEKWVAEKIAGKITQEEMEEYLRLGMREVEMLRQQSEQALTQVNSWARGQLTLIEQISTHVAWLHERTENFAGLVQKHFCEDQEPKFRSLIDEVNRHASNFQKVGAALNERPTMAQIQEELLG